MTFFIAYILLPFTFGSITVYLVQYFSESIGYHYTKGKLKARREYHD
jgi:hypothetical protein